MRLRTAEVLRARLELITAIETASEIHHHRDLVLVHLDAGDQEGWGECSTLPTPGYSPEWDDGAAVVLERELLPLLPLGTPLPAIEEVLARLEAVPGNEMAKAALEMALLDLEGRCAGRSLASRLGAVGDSVPASATIGLCRDPAAAEAAAGAARAAGYRRVKLKIGRGADVAPAAAIRAAFGDLAVVVDANGSYSLDAPEDRAVLVALDGLGLAGVEQPLDRDDLEGHAALRRRISTPVLLDESVTGPVAARRAIDLGAADVLVIKASRLGGLLAAAGLAAECRAAGMALSLGGMLETGIGRAAALALAALPAISVPGDLGASDRYYRADLTDPFVLQPGGRLRVPTGPGLGVVLRGEARRALRPAGGQRVQ